MTETCPAIFMDGDRVVEVALSEWRTDGDGRWNLADAVVVELPGSANRVIFELPFACFEMAVGLDPGPVTVEGDGTGQLARCHRPSRAAVESISAGGTL